jgi:hypothetical protein
MTMTMTDLGTLPGYNHSVAAGINGRGDLRAEMSIYPAAHREGPVLIACVIRETFVLEFAKKLDQVWASSGFGSDEVDVVGRAILVVRLNV